ncbi:unnamed protein product, partial [Symbiodinium pilosum]
MCASLCSWLVLAGCRAREQRLRRRDRSKQAKFHVLLAQGTLPEELRKEWEALSTGKAKTELVNNSISRDDVTGKLSLSCDKAQLSTSTALVSDNKLSRQNKALGKTLFQAKFNLSHRSQRRGGCGERRGIDGNLQPGDGQQAVQHLTFNLQSVQGLDDAPEEQAQPSGFKKEGSALAIEDAKSAPAESQALSDKEWEEAKGLLQQSKDAMGKLLK